MRYNRLCNAAMWLVKLLFLVTIGYAASDIAPKNDCEEQLDRPDVTLKIPPNSYIQTDVLEFTTIRLSSFTDSITT